MSLTLSQGPLSRKPAAANFALEGPAHCLYFEDFPRRVRGMFAGEFVFDTRRGRLLHETGLLPQLYVPRADVRTDLLRATNHHTHCPFKGDASYWSLEAGDRTAGNAAWAYPEPRERAGWLDGYLAFYWSALDAWFDEDEEVQGHLRDPYHRVDVRTTTRRVQVTVGDAVIADTRRPMLLSETGLVNRYYVPPEDVRPELLEPSATHTVCPYKGTASYRTVVVDGRRIPDAAWCYPEPLEDALRVRGYLCFDAEGVVVEVDGDAG